MDDGVGSVYVHARPKHLSKIEPHIDDTQMMVVIWSRAPCSRVVDPVQNKALLNPYIFYYDLQLLPICTVCFFNMSNLELDIVNQKIFHIILLCKLAVSDSKFILLRRCSSMRTSGEVRETLRKNIS
uniref:Uncharacterized protein n=1 Tax=Glossina palpalis gambiensis TaxID=67801 RepID=A0A1B0AX22_9MUSC